MIDVHESNYNFTLNIFGQALGTRFSVRGIPSFFILDAETGRVLDSDGRTTVSNARGDTSKALTKWKVK